MTIADKQAATTERQSTSRRYWHRIDDARPWWPWGILPVVGLVALFLFGALVTAPDIQAEVQTSVGKRFATAGVAASALNSDGQGVAIVAEAPADNEVFMHALAKSTQCDTWAGSLTCPTTVSIRTMEPAVPAEPVAAPAAAPAPSTSYVAVTDNQVPAARQRCEDGFRDILASASVRFRTGSAMIDSGNEELLDRLAKQAGSCPGNLVIEGHTDSQGDNYSNQALSQARASAVRDALIDLGVDPRRVSARGFGESAPIADNATAEGRASNRRIAITANDSE